MTDNNLSKIKNEDNFISRIEELERKIDMMERRGISAGNLAEIAPDLGTIRTGELYALVSGVDPTDADACGVFISSSGQYFLGVNWNMGGVNNGVLMFGLRASDGAALFAGGAAILDASGFDITGLRYAIHHIAYSSGVSDRRDGWLQAWIPTNRTKPGYGLQFTAGDGNLVSNGDAEHGDLSHWTDAGASYSAQSTVVDEGSYSFKCEDLAYGASDTLTGDRVACTAGLAYKFSLKTKDYYLQSTENLSPTADAYLLESNPTVNWGDSMFTFAGYLGGGKTHELLKFNLSSIPSNIYSLSSALLKQYGFAVSSSSTIDVFRLLRDWVELEATWNKASSAVNWGTAGADNTSTDREAANIGSQTVTTTEGWYSWILTPSKILEYINGTLSNYGFLLNRNPETTAYGRFQTKEHASNNLYLSLTYVEASNYDIQVKWYDDASAGSLLQTDTICSENGVSDWNLREKMLTAPTGAQSFSIVVSVAAGKVFYFDEVYVSAALGALYFDPQLVQQRDDGTIERVVSARREMYAPVSAPVASLVSGAGNVNAGTHSYKVIFVDAYGETTPSAKSNVVTTIDAP